LIVYRITRGCCYYPPSLIVCNEGTGYRNTGRENGGRSEGPAETRRAKNEHHATRTPTRRA
tara:strand:+ start:2696 stop:2878 length:183 start_codon:yes stop_codon:yes gene_type:complete